MPLDPPLALPLQADAISPYNPLVVALVLLAAGAALAALFLLREARDAHTPGGRESFAWLFGLVGVVGLLVSGEIFWANWAGFPAHQYTELFGVAQTLYAVVMLAAAVTLYHDTDPRPFGWLTAVSGVVLFEGARAVLAFGLTLQPLVAAAIWTGAGVTAVLVLVATYTPQNSDGRRYVLYAAALVAALVALAALAMGLEAHFGHIAEAMASA